jgi:hypothetical protein
LFLGKSNNGYRNHYIQGPKSILLRFPVALALHFQVGAAVALVVVGYTSNANNGPTLAKVGYILFVALVVMIAALTLLSWRYSHTNIDSKRVSKRDSNQLWIGFWQFRSYSSRSPSRSLCHSWLFELSILALLLLIRA